MLWRLIMVRLQSSSCGDFGTYHEAPRDRSREAAVFETGNMLHDFFGQDILRFAERMSALSAIATRKSASRGQVGVMRHPDEVVPCI
ncbi:hypothetical protein A7A09_001965 [Paracoccus methylarcula]|uniref:Uncharacterized protein n=1 Tax=Paracoccus methylarcula TaxID=72022 RepID=A0A3R7PRM1_9RHOB|nr:hypothetical protein A7A09_001965 [Paracoccus methylarcula]